MVPKAGPARPREMDVTRRELLERLDTAIAALGPQAPTNFNSSLFGDAALLKRIEAFEAQINLPEKPKVADYTGNMFSRIANRRAAGAK